MLNTQILFQLGTTVITPGARAVLTNEIAYDLLARHQRGDWGDLGDDDKRENDFSVPRPLRIFSAYKVGEGEKVWVITEADRSSTTILLPDEY